MPIDTSMLASTINIMENPISRHSFTGKIPEPEGLSHPVVSPFSGYRTQDGLIYVAISNTNRYRVFVEALERPELAVDPRFGENKDRVENDDLLRKILEDILKERTTDEWEKFLIPKGVPVSSINNVLDVKEQFPEVFSEVNHPVVGSALLPGSPVAFDGGLPGFDRPAPTVGQHTDEILSEIGYSSEEIQELHAANII